ncbi:hypothetical protein RDI58_007715 [Solanum bulbocastanum]|uniref:Uncharacterized protein n=1 Tax=Solanum bulbocastanum TaxID=147425 RepID=A0AAN8YJ56_SOLBU
MVNGGGCCDFIFYITSSDKTPDDKDVIFQAKVTKDLNYRLQFSVIRPKVIVDLDRCYMHSNLALQNRFPLVLLLTYGMLYLEVRFDIVPLCAGKSVFLCNLLFISPCSCA